MGSHTLAKIDGPHYVAGCEINDPHKVAVCARLANSRVTVDWHERPFPIRRRRHFMAGDAVLCDRSNLTARRWINNPESLVSLVGDQEQPTPTVAVRFRGIQSGLCAGGIESQQ
jgi:hypothetical protein